MTHIQKYLSEVIVRQVPRLLSTLDREPDSEAYGCFDRDYWAWKLRDFPVTMLQYAMIPLAHVYQGNVPNSPYTGSSRLAAWIEAAANRIITIQRRNGAFESVAPNAEDYGVSLAMAYALVEVAPIVHKSRGDAFKQAVRKAAEYGLHSEEDYAFISNHQALFALSYYRIGQWLQDERFLNESERIVQEILARQSKDGPFDEYGGADPGYETLGIFYLALLWQQTKSLELFAALQRSLHFLSHCVHPDGSIGGVYGSRHTQVFHPGGLAILAQEIPLAEKILQYVFEHQNAIPVVSLDTVDALNLPVLLHGYLVAASQVFSGEPLPNLPCESLQGRVDFQDAGIHVIGRARYYGVVSSKKGGVCRFHSREGHLLHQDAGWMLRRGKERWVSQCLESSSRVKETAAPEQLTCGTRFSRMDLPFPTPLRFLLLRVANLTAFRWAFLAKVLRRKILESLILKRKPGPFVLERVFRFQEEGFEWVDRVVSDAGEDITDAHLMREFTAIHMGSARYFHLSELDITAGPPIGTHPVEWNRQGEWVHRMVVDARRSGEQEY